MLHEEKTIKSEIIYNGRILNLRVDTIELPEMKYSKREIVQHSGGVGIIALTDDKRVILVKQYRKAVETFTWEIPAGKLELNENPRDTGIRELAEETGYRAKNIKYITEFYPTPGYCSEKIYLFMADGLIEGPTKFDYTENIEVSLFRIDELLKMINNGEIRDAKTIISIFLLRDLLNDKNEFK